MTDAFTIWLLLRLVEEAGFEPTCLLVTPGRLRNAKGIVQPHTDRLRKGGGARRVERSVFAQFIRLLSYR